MKNKVIRRVSYKCKKHKNVRFSFDNYPLYKVDLTDDIIEECLMHSIDK